MLLRRSNSMMPAGVQGASAGTLRNKIADVDRMKAVYIFFRSYGQKHLLCVHMRRQGQLHQDGINIIALVQRL